LHYLINWSSYNNEVTWCDNAPPPSAEVKNAWSCTSATPKRIHDVVLN